MVSVVGLTEGDFIGKRRRNSQIKKLVGRDLRELANEHKITVFREGKKNKGLVDKLSKDVWVCP